jgi:hypothetical protein
MDGLARSVGDGISGLVGDAVTTIAAGISGIVAAVEASVPGGMLAVGGVLAGAVLLRFVLRR